jgi:DNA-binding beta-propeller fold protein YncE
VLVVSAPSATTAGIATIIDYSGDSVMATANIGIGPTAFAVDILGSAAYTINSNGTLANFPISKSLQDNQVLYTTLSSTAEPLNLFSSVNGLWAADLYGNVGDAFSGSPETFLRSIPLAPTPVFVVGPAGNGQRDFGISQGSSISTGVECNVSPSTVASNGEADGIEVSSYTISSQIPLGKCPVYAVESSDNKRLFVLNRGSDTITVINTQNDTLDTCTPFVDPETGRTVSCHPSLPLSTTAGLAQDANNEVPAVAGPVYAEYNVATSQLVVANYDGGTISIIDVSMDQYGNDSATFGTTFTVPVGKNPASVTVLYDGSRAYTANQADDGTGNGTVSIVNVSSHTVVKTLPVTGHPRTVVSTQNSSYGKVYVASPDSNVLTIIRTDEDIVDATVLVEGNIVDVRASSPSATSGTNANTVSRMPGHGQPCNLPLSEVSTADLVSNPALCQSQSLK